MEGEWKLALSLHSSEMTRRDDTAQWHRQVTIGRQIYVETVCEYYIYTYMYIFMQYTCIQYTSMYVFVLRSSTLEEQIVEGSLEV